MKEPKISKVEKRGQRMLALNWSPTIETFPTWKWVRELFMTALTTEVKNQGLEQYRYEIRQFYNTARGAVKYLENTCPWLNDDACVQPTHDI